MRAWRSIFTFIPHTWRIQPLKRAVSRAEHSSRRMPGIIQTDCRLQELMRRPGSCRRASADPSANAGDVVGNLKAITQNGGAPDTTAGQFINYIKGYVDKHSMMYAQTGSDRAEPSENYEAVFRR